MCSYLLGPLATFDAWLFYAIHWASVAVTVLVAMNAARELWDTYGC